MKRPSSLPRAILSLVLAVSAGAGAFAAKASLNAYFPVDFNDAAYRQQAFARVQKSWVLPKSTPAVGGKAVVRATIGSDGKLISSVLHMSSGVKVWDGAGLAAVKASAPFAPLPRSYRGSQIEVHWHFAVAP